MFKALVYTGFCVLFILSTYQVSMAQMDSVLLTKNFKFNDGIYLSFIAFQNNTPDYTWSEVRANVFSNPQTFITQVENISLKDTTNNKTLEFSDIWGISLDGIPYLQLPKGVLSNSLTTFAGLRVRGRLCFFSYEKEEMKKVKMQAFNPLTGQPFRTGYVDREVVTQYSFTLDFETGKVMFFNQENFLAQIEEDQQLWRTVKEMSSLEIQEKLFKCLLIYDDRNEVYIHK